LVNKRSLGFLALILIRPALLILQFIHLLGLENGPAKERQLAVSQEGDHRASYASDKRLQKRRQATPYEVSRLTGSAPSPSIFIIRRRKWTNSSSLSPDRFKGALGSPPSFTADSFGRPPRVGEGRPQARRRRRPRGAAARPPGALDARLAQHARHHRREGPASVRSRAVCCGAATHSVRVSYRGRCGHRCDGLAVGAACTPDAAWAVSGRISPRISTSSAHRSVRLAVWLCPPSPVGCPLMAAWQSYQA